MSYYVMGSLDQGPRSAIAQTSPSANVSPLAAALLAVAGLCGWLPAQAQCLLGGQPSCEASAALVVDCLGGVGRCLLVGDNGGKGARLN
jgi:hypothetical protein